MTQLKKRWKELADAAVPEEGKPIVEMAGDRRVLIENHQGVLACGRETIAVKVSYGEVWIIGKDLEILVMGAEQLVVGGRAEQLLLKRRGKT